MCFYYYKYLYCSEGANCVAGYGWVNRSGRTYVKEYRIEQYRKPCDNHGRGCTRLDYMGSDTKQSEDRCDDCKDYNRGRSSRR
ncbi:hypothetical protein B0H65DRAFT_436986 [Neurospora tetraspora]|uniref:Uncharacterized protein n=1 Tax=Neurospora tetraspora TaxID=94610 RepID=A0AAE0J092_9PEZI|nr:hypothetical protein B0H65DRAFT_436986 [Neurospora tetraspora]